jgi:hypothetical protein
MLQHTTFTITAGRASEWLACLWQGPAPEDLKVREWLRLAGEPRSALLTWCRCQPHDSSYRIPLLDIGG